MLSVESVTINYGESAVVRDVSMRVDAQKVVCLMGRNGVGKTTLLKSVMGILTPRKGSISFGDVDMTRRPPNVRAKSGIGYVPQGRGIFPFLSVYENLLIGIEALQAKDAQARLDEVYSVFPVLAEMKTRAAGTLSGGQQQQLAIGRALVCRPRLLILDEPTEGVQPSIMHQIEDTLIRLRENGNMSILLVEQFLDFALRVADDYYVMDTGSIVASGKIKEFDEALVKEYLAI